MYEPCTYCKYKPGEEGGDGGKKGGAGKRGGGKKKGGGGKRGNSITERGKGGGGSGGGKYAADIKAGKIQGEPGQKSSNHNAPLRSTQIMLPKPMVLELTPPPKSFACRLVVFGQTLLWRQIS